MFDRSRSVWEEPGFTVAEHTTSPPVNRSRITDVVIHYPGHDGVGDDTARDLANSQRYYCINRGYSLGYNAVVDRAGVLWQVRGMDYQNAANKGANPTTVSVQLRTNIGEPASPAAVTRVQRFVSDVRRWAGNPTIGVVGHRDVGSTACPGDAIYNQVQRGMFEPEIDLDVTMKIIDPPQRVYDTRKQTGRFNDGETRKINVGQPNAKAVFVNVTCVAPSGAGFATVWGAGPMPDVSNVNYTHGDTICNTSWIPVAGDGTIQVYCYSSCDVLVDVQAVAS